MDNNVNYLKKAQLSIQIGDKYYSFQTDNQGIFDFYLKPTNYKRNTVRIAYEGNNKYKESATKKSVYVPVPKKYTKVTLQNIPKANIGDKVPIYGKLTDANGNTLKNTPLTATINGKKYSMKTDEYGYFDYYYTSSKAGKNTIKITYKGSSKYKSSSVTKTFQLSNYKKVTLAVKKSSFYTTKYIDGDPFCSLYSPQSGQYNRGVYVKIDTRGLNNPPVNKIVKAVFYFKNSNGNVITKTGRNIITCHVSELH